MSKRTALVALSVLILAAPALARDAGSGWSRSGGNRSGVTQRPQNGGWTHHHQAGGKWRGHDHFSPRGQGGHHWGW